MPVSVGMLELQVCRHELPTDDDTYERRKVREAEAAEATRGAEGALSHNEFMYL